MKKIFWLVPLFLVTLLCLSFSCQENTGYSLGDFRIAIATVKSDANKSYSLLLDNGQLLWPAASDVSQLYKDNQRVFLNYTILSDRQNGYDHYVKVNDMWKILTKPIVKLNSDNELEIGNDPIRVNAAWIGGDFLNIDFLFNYGGVRPHFINLVENTKFPSTVQDVIQLEFRHNAYNSTQSTLHEGMVCFDLKPLRAESRDSVKISVQVKEPEALKTYNLVYRYNEAASGNRFMDTPIPIISTEQYQ